MNRDIKHCCDSNYVLEKERMELLVTRIDQLERHLCQTPTSTAVSITVTTAVTTVTAVATTATAASATTTAHFKLERTKSVLSQLINMKLLMLLVVCWGYCYCSLSS